MSKTKVLFVCMGNICRSPLAEVALSLYLKKHSLENLFEVSSAGISAFHVGEAPDKRALKIAYDNGLNLITLARQFEYDDLHYYDYILAMDHLNYEDIVSMAKIKEEVKQVFLLRSFDPEADKLFDVPDPYYGLSTDFEEVFNICQRSVKGFMEFLGYKS